MPRALKELRRAVAHHAANLSQLLCARMIRQRSGSLRSDLFESRVVRARLADLVEASLKYNSALHDWRESRLSRLSLPSHHSRQPQTRVVGGVEVVDVEPVATGAPLFIPEG